jgi:type II secretory pathway component PulF
MLTLSDLTRQIARHLGEGVSLADALRRACDAADGALAEAFGGAAETVAGGGLLSDAVKRRPDVFDPVYVWCVGSGETGEDFWPGIRETSLRHAASYLEDDAWFARTEAAGGALPAARLLRAVAWQISIGVPLCDALTAIAASPGCAALASEAVRVRDALLAGHDLHVCLAARPTLYPGLVVEATALGEEVGMLDLTLFDVTAHAMGRRGVPDDDGEHAALRARIVDRCKAHSLALTAARRELLDVLTVSALEILARQLERYGRFDERRWATRAPTSSGR